MMHIHVSKLVLLLLTMLPLTSSAQWSFDVATIEAYIKDHKAQRELLQTRTVLEECNKELHDCSRKANTEYKDLNENLDKYTRAFDVISLLYESLHACITVYNTYNTVENRIEDYRKMLADFHDKCLSRGNIVTTDTLILSVNKQMIENIAHESENLYRSVNDLVIYVTGQASCTTADLILTVSSISSTLDNIQKHLNTAYFETWRYIQVRIGYWKKQVYRAQTIEDIVHGALGRWRHAGRLIKE